MESFEPENLNTEPETPIGELETLPDFPVVPPKKVKKRIPELDLLRFVAIVLMFVVHYNYLLAFVFDGIWEYGDRLYSWVYSAENYFRTAYKPMQMTCGVMFTVLSGVTTSWTGGKKGVLKGAKYLAIAFGMTAVLWIFDLITGFNLIIIFGVIHMLASSMLLYSALKLLFFKVFKTREYVFWTVITALGIALALIGFLIDLDAVRVNTNIFAFIGLTDGAFYSADYYPMLPWTGLFFIGAAAGSIIYRDKKTKFPFLENRAAQTVLKPFTTIGRYSIQFYLVHQVALFGIFYLLGLVFN